MSNYPENLEKGFYRVIESEENPAIVLGAFRVLSNAKRQCDLYPGSYVVYDSGEKVYPVEEDSSGVEEPEGGTGEEPVTPDSGSTGSDSEDTGGGEGSGEEPGGTAGEDGGEGSSEGSGGEEPGGDDSGSIAGEDGEGSGGENPGGDTGSEPEGGGETTDPDNPSELPVIAYGKLKTMMHIRADATQESTAFAIYNAKTIVQIVEFCENGWLKIRCGESPTGIGYVSNIYDQYAYIGYSYYVVAEEGERIEEIAVKMLGDESRYMEIRQLNMLTSNQTYVGMELIMPVAVAAG